MLNAMWYCVPGTSCKMAIKFKCFVCTSAQYYYFIVRDQREITELDRLICVFSLNVFYKPIKVNPGLYETWQTLNYDVGAEMYKKLLAECVTRVVFGFQGETTPQQTASCSTGSRTFSGSAPWSWWRTPASRSFKTWWLIVRMWTGNDAPLQLVHSDQLTDTLMKKVSSFVANFRPCAMLLRSGAGVPRWRFISMKFGTTTNATKRAISVAMATVREIVFFFFFTNKQKKRQFIPHAWRMFCEIFACFTFWAYSYKQTRKWKTLMKDLQWAKKMKPKFRAGLNRKKLIKDLK